MKSLTETVLEQSRSMNLETYSYSVLYTGFGSGGNGSSFGNAGFGLLNADPFQYGYDMPGSGRQLHLHGPDRTTLTYGTIEDYSGKVLKELNGYESSMANLNAGLLGLKKFP